MAALTYCWRFFRFVWGVGCELSALPTWHGALLSHFSFPFHLTAHHVSSCFYNPLYHQYKLFIGSR